MRSLRFPAKVLLFAISALFLLSVTLPKKDYSATERRYLAKFPDITLQSLTDGSTGEKVEDYLADHFPGHNLFVGINAYWNLLTGRNTAGSVYHCRDHYLINAPENCGTAQMEKNLSRFDTFAADAGIPGTLLLIPTAGDVMEEVLPANHAPYHYEEYLARAEEICGNLKVLPLADAIGCVRQPYYKTDHHLTSAGCHAVYQAFCRSQGRKALAEDAYAVTRYDGFHGSTWTSSGYWLTPTETLETWDAGDPLTVTVTEAGSEDVTVPGVFFTGNLESDDWYTVFLDGNHALVQIDNETSPEGGVLLVLRDSYGSSIAPFLASDYRKVILVDLRYYRYSVSQLIEENGVTELAVIYGLDSMLTDSNSAWLY